MYSNYLLSRTKKTNNHDNQNNTRYSLSEFQSRKQSTLNPNKTFVNLPSYKIPSKRIIQLPKLMSNHSNSTIPFVTSTTKIQKVTANINHIQSQVSSLLIDLKESIGYAKSSRQELEQQLNSLQYILSQQIMDLSMLVKRQKQKAKENNDKLMENGLKLKQNQIMLKQRMDLLKARMNEIERQSGAYTGEDKYLL